MPPRSLAANMLGVAQPATLTPIKRHARMILYTARHTEDTPLGSLLPGNAWIANILATQGCVPSHPSPSCTDYLILVDCFDYGSLAMPSGPRGEKRPADMISCAVQVARLSVGLEDETLKEPSGRVRSGQAGSRARADKLSPERRREIAKKAAGTRWG